MAKYLVLVLWLRHRFVGVLVKMYLGIKEEKGHVKYIGRGSY